LSCKVHLDVRSLRIIHVDGSADRELLLPTFRLSLPGSFEPLCGLYLHLIKPCRIIAFWCWCFENLFLQTCFLTPGPLVIRKTSSPSPRTHERGSFDSGALVSF
jgi:hypothetical protein